MKRLSLLYLGRRGAGPIYTIEFAKALLDKSVILQVIVSSYSENIADWRVLESKYLGTGKLYLNEVRTYNSIKEFVFRSLNWKTFYDIYISIIRFNPDFLVATMIHPWHNILCYFLKNKVKRIKVIHDVNPHAGEDSFFHRLLSYVDLHWSDLLVVLSRKSKKLLIDKGFDGSKIEVIPHANFGYYSVGREQSETHICNRIGFFGRINKYKGLGVLLEAFKEVRTQIPDLRLLIAGNGDCREYESHFLENSESLELQIRWISDDEVYSLLQHVDIVVLPYIEASQSGVIPLAFAMGKPVVATNVGGLPEQVPSNAGIIVPANDARALKQAIVDLYNDPQMILDMGQYAAEYAKRDLSWDKSAELLLNFCNSHINENSSNHNSE